jgi:hypothetical protein
MHLTIFYIALIIMSNRGGGQRGACVENLRGTQGTKFEGLGKITRGTAGMIGFCCCSSREIGKERYLLIKGPFCFVFVSKEDPAPKYAVGLQSMHAKFKSAGSNVVVLEGELGDVEYEFAFNDVETANQFKAAIDIESESAQVAAVRKRLGHEHLLSKRSSLIFAETIAMQKLSEQPDAPISNREIASVMPPI